MSTAIKWLLVTCFGYLGYKNAKFGRVESHEEVTAAGRECMLEAKAVAENMGYELLHGIVDSLFLYHPTNTSKEDYAPLLFAILDQTKIPIELEGVFRWICFPPSRMNDQIATVTNYFGVYQDGSYKMRGIEARRHNTPPFIKETQIGLIKILAQAETLEKTVLYLPEAFEYVDNRRRLLASNQVSVSELVRKQKLSRPLDAYKAESPTVVAARQLCAQGRTPQQGDTISFIHTGGEQSARAWHNGSNIDKKEINPRLYLQLFDRAVETILGSFEKRFPETIKENHQYQLAF